MSLLKKREQTDYVDEKVPVEVPNVEVTRRNIARRVIPLIGAAIAVYGGYTSGDYVYYGGAAVLVLLSLGVHVFTGPVRVMKTVIQVRKKAVTREVTDWSETTTSWAFGLMVLVCSVVVFGVGYVLEKWVICVVGVLIPIVILVLGKFPVIQKIIRVIFYILVAIAVLYFLFVLPQQVPQVP